MSAYRFFDEYFARVGFSDSVRSYLIQELVRDGRHYHGVGHIALLLKYFQKSAFIGKEAMNALIVASFFHDIVYDPTRGDNEELSAMEMRLRLDQKDTPADLDLVERMILASKGHARTKDGAVNIFLAGDLSILWSPIQTYRWYAHGVRQEYKHVPNEIYRPRRAEVLEKLQGSFYDFFFAPLKGVGQGINGQFNYAWELDALKQGLLDV